MEESNEQILVDWDDQQVKDRLDEVLFEGECIVLKTSELLSLKE